MSNLFCGAVFNVTFKSPFFQDSDQLPFFRSSAESRKFSSFVLWLPGQVRFFHFMLAGAHVVGLIQPKFVFP